MALTTESALRKDQTNAGGRLEHRHFAVIAGIIADMPAQYRRDVAETFAAGLEHTNPRFDRARFLRACGVMS